MLNFFSNKYAGRSDLFKGLDTWKDMDEATPALSQIEEKQYAANLISHGIAEDHTLKYGFAFRGKKCLIKGSR